MARRRNRKNPRTQSREYQEDGGSTTVVVFDRFANRLLQLFFKYSGPLNFAGTRGFSGVLIEWRGNAAEAACTF